MARGDDVERLFVVDRSAGEAPISYPPLLTQAGTFLTSVVKFVQSGLQTSSQELYERRLAICEACPLYDAGRCVKCGCYTHVKLRIAGEVCPHPDGPKWGAEELEQGM